MTENSSTSQRKNWNAVGIETVLKEEEDEIVRLCKLRGARDRLDPDDPQRLPERLGVAFSGGGIRSASVNIGLLQAFARIGLLKQTHYISAVSGGGYALGWLIAWIARVGFEKVNDELASNRDTGKSTPTAYPGVFARYLERQRRYPGRSRDLPAQPAACAEPRGLRSHRRAGRRSVVRPCIAMDAGKPVGRGPVRPGHRDDVRPSPRDLHRTLPWESRSQSAACWKTCDRRSGRDSQRCCMCLVVAWSSFACPSVFSN